jgi:hypothetical protein
MIKNIQIGTIYFYQGFAGCLFVKVIKKCGDRFLVITGIDATFLQNVENLETSHEYEKHRESGNLSGIWTVEEKFILKAILIPFKKLPESRLKRLNKRPHATQMVIPNAMDKEEEKSFLRERKINSVIYD